MADLLQRACEPTDEELPSLLVRPSDDSQEIQRTVSDVIDTVRIERDSALYRFALKFDGVELSSLNVSSAEFEEAERLVPETLKQAIRVAADNIKAFHASQLPQGERVETSPGVECWRKIVPIQRVGLYVPGGTAPLFSTVLMLSIPARVAGCPRIVLCTPPSGDGSVHPAILYAAKIGGVDTVYKIGGAQAIAAMALGTESVPKVDKIFGPGNRYVTCAKQRVSVNLCSIDMPAGPSEVMVVADSSSEPAFVASDLLSQAEHGKDSQAMLIIHAPRIEGMRIADEVEKQLARQIDYLGRHEYLLPSLSHSRAIICERMERVVEVVNQYAPEHLIISTAEPEALERSVVNAGSIFLGPWSPESAGDYASGTNHTLPTSGWAHSTSGVSVDSFIKKITVQKLSADGLRRLGPTVQAMAAAEHLAAHANAVSIRLGDAGKLRADIGGTL